jgi:hypothetical protein
MKFTAFLFLCLWFSTPLLGQSVRLQSDTTIEGVVSTLYKVISGPPGARDWQTFRDLFHKNAVMGTVVEYPGKEPAFRNFSPEDYIRMNDDFFKKHGFTERELHTDVFRYGNIAQVASAYESLVEDTNEKERGINAIQLIQEGGRWYVLSLIWQDEAGALPLPAAFNKQ